MFDLNYHTEHHLDPQERFYRRSALHRRLLADPSYTREVDVRCSYVSFLSSRV